MLEFCSRPCARRSNRPGEWPRNCVSQSRFYFTPKRRNNHTRLYIDHASDLGCV